MFSVGVLAPSGNFLLDYFTGARLAVSVRKLRSHYTGLAMTVRRSSDNAETDVSFDKNNLVTGESPVSAGGDFATWFGASSVYIKTWYDQTIHANNCTQTTAANQPRIVNAGVFDTYNGAVAPYFDGSQFLSAADSNSLDLDASLSFSVVCDFPRPSINNSSIFDKRANGGNSTGYHAYYRQSDNTLGFQWNGTSGFNNPTVNSGTSAGILYSISMAATKNNTVERFRNKTSLGTANIATTGSTVNTVAFLLCGHKDTPTSRFLGNFAEFVLYPVRYTTADENLVQQNQQQFYAL